MNYGRFDASFSASGDTEPDNKSIFHDIRHFQELRASLVNAIEARKGLILLTGGEGTGKTMFLHSFIRELKSDVTFIAESDPDASFTDLLKLILRNLDHEAAGADRLSMLQTCKRLLRAAMDRGDAICLILDNAERLCDDTLECVFQNFLGPAASGDREQKLLQIILTGRPQLRERLSHPPLRAIAPPLGLVCNIEPLSHAEAADYARRRLHAGQLPPRSLQSEAIDRILGYASGNLRVINSLCSRALALAEESSAGTISVQLVDAAAGDLGIAKSPRSENKTRKQNFEIPRDRDEPFGFRLGEDDSTEVVGQTFLNYHANEPRPWLRPRERDRTVVRLVLVLIFLGAGFLWLQDQLGGLSLTDWSEKLATLSGASHPTSTQPGTDSQTPLQTAQIEPPAPVTENLPPPNAEQTVANPSRIETDKPIDSGDIGSPEKPPDRPVVNTPKPTTKTSSLPGKNEERRRSALQKREPSDRQLESEIYRAIENRAINGVEVSVNNGTVYLAGRVATERQKRAAEAAARSVDGVDRVLSRIVVS